MPQCHCSEPHITNHSPFPQCQQAAGPAHIISQPYSHQRPSAAMRRPPPWPQLPPLLLLLLLLSLFCIGPLQPRLVHGTFFESHPSCGYPDGPSTYVQFASTTNLGNEPSLGVCDWGFDSIPGLGGYLGRCLSCTFIPTSSTTCPGSGLLVDEDTWWLAKDDNCEQKGCINVCPSKQLQKSAVYCGKDGTDPLCCALQPYRRCCRYLACTVRNSPVGHCVIQDKDLLPGQTSPSPAFAVQATSTDCHRYSLRNVTRTCGADRTFPTAKLYDSCIATSAPTDGATGCPLPAGYSYVPGYIPADAQEALLDDGTAWHLLTDPSAEDAAAFDVVLMASRCDADSLCAGFDTSGRTSLLSYIPTQSRLAPFTAGGACGGMYVKMSSSSSSGSSSSVGSSCARVDGYILAPLTAPDDVNSGSGGGSSNSTALALECDRRPECGGFSSRDGLLSWPLSPVSAQAPFTTTPCRGTFTRVSTEWPSEVEGLDHLLCGATSYCSSRIQYTASTSSDSAFGYYVDVEVLLLETLQLPDFLTREDSDSNTATALLRQQLPHVRRLSLTCAPAASLLGGLPRPLALLFPLLQELSISNCATAGELPAAWSNMAYLRTLDLSGNQLGGGLPPSWGNQLRLAHLNLSGNALTGPVPSSWVNIVSATSTPVDAKQLAMVLAGSSGSSGRSLRASEAVPPPPLHAQLIVDLSGNQLSGPVSRSLLQTSCLDRSLVLQFDAMGYEDNSWGGHPLMLLHSNPDLRQWVGQYRYAEGKGAYDWRDHAHNMCGAYKYLITIGVLWGAFGLSLLLIIAWRISLMWRRKRSQFILSDSHLTETAEGPGGGADCPDSVEGSGGGADPDGHEQCSAVVDSGAAAQRRRRGSVATMLRSRWLRRTLFAARHALLLANLATDVAVAVWLYRDGESSEAAVCTAFIALAQASVALACFCTLAPNMFSGVLVAAFFLPPLLAVMPLLAPAMALAYVYNPNVPLVSWRYLEVLEFSIMLLQSPAQAIVQTVVYARQNQLANGMYLDHRLFIISIVLSLVDMLVTSIKLLRYRRGPWARIVVAFTHLDKTRDTFTYLTGSQPLLAARSLMGPAAMGRPSSEGPLTQLHQLQQMHSGGGEVTEVGRISDIDAPLNPTKQFGDSVSNGKSPALLSMRRSTLTQQLSVAAVQRAMAEAAAYKARRIFTNSSPLADSTATVGVAAATAAVAAEGSGRSHGSTSRRHSGTAFEGSQPWHLPPDDAELLSLAVTASTSFSRPQHSVSMAGAGFGSTMPSPSIHSISAANARDARGSSSCGGGSVAHIRRPSRGVEAFAHGPEGFKRVSEGVPWPSLQAGDIDLADSGLTSMHRSNSVQRDGCSACSSGQLDGSAVAAGEACTSTTGCIEVAPSQPAVSSYTPLTTSQYRPSLLSQGSSRLIASHAHGFSSTGSSNSGIGLSQSQTAYHAGRSNSGLSGGSPAASQPLSVVMLSRTSLTEGKGLESTLLSRKNSVDSSAHSYSMPMPPMLPLGSYPASLRVLPLDFRQPPSTSPSFSPSSGRPPRSPAPFQPPTPLPPLHASSYFSSPLPPRPSTLIPLDAAFTPLTHVSHGSSQPSLATSGAVAVQPGSSGDLSNGPSPMFSRPITPTGPSPTTSRPQTPLAHSHNGEIPGRTSSTESFSSASDGGLVTNQPDRTKPSLHPHGSNSRGIRSHSAGQDRSPLSLPPQTTPFQQYRPPHVGAGVCMGSMPTLPNIRTSSGGGYLNCARSATQAEAVVIVAGALGSTHSPVRRRALSVDVGDGDSNLQKNRGSVVVGTRNSGSESSGNFFAMPASAVGQGAAMAATAVGSMPLHGRRSVAAAPDERAERCDGKAGSSLPHERSS